MSKLRKCGEFMEKDGIVVKRPGKKFVCPPMPAKMRITYHKNEHMREIDNTEEMNALKEIRCIHTGILVNCGCRHTRPQLF